LAKNRYGWNKRIKEIARKMKQEDKLKRRQSKSQEISAEDVPEEMDTDSAPEAVAKDSSPD
jgi:hypothetical protein